MAPAGSRSSAIALLSIFVFMCASPCDAVIGCGRTALWIALVNSARSVLPTRLSACVSLIFGGRASDAALCRCAVYDGRWWLWIASCGDRRTEGSVRRVDGVLLEPRAQLRARET